MAVAEQNSKPQPLPRNEIPEAWAGRGHCPACDATPLRVVHLSGSADYLLCARCELSFEVAENGGAIRIKQFSEKLEFAEGELRYRWVQPATLPKLLENRAKILQEKVTGPAPKSLSDDEVWSRMLAFHKLGNQPKMIQFTLIQAGATQAQAEAAFVRLKKWSAQNAKRQTGRFWKISGVAFLLIFAVAAGTWGFVLYSINAKLKAGAQGPAAQTGQPFPVQLLEKLPDNIKPGFLKSPPTILDDSGPSRARCPVQAQEAADLFGGAASAWKPGGQVADSWQMLDSGAPSTIRIPQGMYAGYIDNKTFKFLSANGPATIHNVNFVTILCN
jgi:hypothetical protein